MSGKAKRRRANAPIFHIPVGLTRDDGGKVVPFSGEADASETVDEWQAMILRHPDTLAAGACVTIGPTITTYWDVRTKTAIQSRTKEGIWQPAAISDLHS